MLDVVQIGDGVDLRVLDPPGVLLEPLTHLDGEEEDEDAEEGEDGAHDDERPEQGLVCMREK